MLCYTDRRQRFHRVHVVELRRRDLIQQQRAGVLPYDGAAAGIAGQGRDISGDPVLAKHADWCAQLRSRYTFTQDNAMEILRAETGRVFTGVLEDAGVYKCTPQGREAFLRFVAQVNSR